MDGESRRRVLAEGEPLPRAMDAGARSRIVRRSAGPAVSRSARPAYGLVLDIQGAQSVHRAGRGIGRYLDELTRALLPCPGLVRALMLNPRKPFPGQLPADLLASPQLARNTADAFGRAERAGPVAYCVLSPFEFDRAAEKLVPPHASRPDVPLIVTLHDLIPLIMPETYLRNVDFARWYRRRLDLFREADLVLAVSEHSRRDGIRLLGLAPERVVAIGAGVSPAFRPARSDPLPVVRRALPRITRPFVFSVAGTDDRKNVGRLLAAYGELPAGLRGEHQLVVTCALTPDVQRAWVETARAVGLRDDEVVFTGYVADHLLRALYQAAKLFVFPSLYEGFGLPVAEAMASGCPTIASNTSSLPEIVDWEPATFDPRDPKSIAAVAERALADREFRGRLRALARSRARIHTWGVVAERVRAALQRLPAPSGRS